MKKIIFVFIAVLLAVGGAFYGGMKYQQSKSPFGNLSRENFQNLSSEQRQQLQANVGNTIAGGADRRASSNFISGEVIAIDEQSLTIKMPEGGSKIVLYSGATEISKFTNGNSGDLEVGKTISVTGETNDDGSITAQSIQIRPNVTPPQ